MRKVVLAVFVVFYKVIYLHLETFRLRSLLMHQLLKCTRSCLIDNTSDGDLTGTNMCMSSAYITQKTDLNTRTTSLINILESDQVSALKNTRCDIEHV